MNAYTRIIRTLALIAATAVVPKVQAIEYSYPASSTERNRAISQATGYLSSSVGVQNWRGSAVVARHSQLLYSCAHVIWDNGQWATANNIKFHRAYHSSVVPNDQNGASVRGYRYFTGYTPAANIDKDTPAAFTHDFVIMYSNSALGTATRYFATSGGSWMLSSARKEILGYPASIHYTNADGYHYQHTTGAFYNAAYQDYYNYYRIVGVSTGPGNSGGPVFVRDGSGYDGLAAILVSGTSDGTRCGVRIMDGTAYSMGTNALADLGYDVRIRDTLTNKRKLRLKDGNRRFQKRTVNARGFIGNVYSVQFSTKIRAANRGDLDVYLKSPSGRIKWISRNKGGRANNLKVKNQNLTGAFRGLAANGQWGLYMRDEIRGGKSTFVNFSLSLSD